MKIFSDLRYHTSERAVMDFYAPENAKTVLVWFHGGGIEAGGKEWARNLAMELGKKDIAVAAPSYSLYPNTSYPQYLEDAAAAVAYVFDHAAEMLPNFGCDDACTQKIFVGGTSAGGYISMMLCFDSGLLAAHGMKSTQIAGFVFDAGQPTTHFNLLRERGVDTRLVRVDDASPLYHMTPELCTDENAPYLYFIWADNDIFCRAEQNKLMIASLIHMGYAQTKISSRCMRSFEHTKYDEVPECGGTMLSETISAFIGPLV